LKVKGSDCADELVSSSRGEVTGEGERRGKRVGLIGKGKAFGDLEWVWCCYHWVETLDLNSHFRTTLVSPSSLSCVLVTIYREGSAQWSWVNA